MNQTSITDPILRKVNADLKDALGHLGQAFDHSDVEMYLAVEALTRAVASVALAVDRLSEVCDFEP